MRRIVVWGATGSGKTTFARRLAAILGVPAVDLDEIRHANGWDSTPFDEFRVILTERLDRATEGWVTAGGYGEVSDVYLSRCDTVIWLHLPWRISFWRLLNRTIPRALSGARVYENSPARESLRSAFLSRDSLLWWSIHHHLPGQASTRERMAALPPQIRAYVLRTPREVEAFLQNARQTALPIE